MPRPRLTIRRLMIAVAVACIFLGVARLCYFSHHYNSLSAMHGSTAGALIIQAQGIESQRLWYTRQITNHPELVPGSNWERIASEFGDGVHNLRLLAAYESRLKRKYGYAARHPWLPVTPDPPGPQLIGFPPP